MPRSARKGTCAWLESRQVAFPEIWLSGFPDRRDGRDGRRPNPGHAPRRGRGGGRSWHGPGASSFASRPGPPSASLSGGKGAPLVTVPPPGRPWCNRKRTWAAAVWLAFPVFYVAPGGLASHAITRGWLPSSTAVFLTDPALRLAADLPGRRRRHLLRLPRLVGEARLPVRQRPPTRRDPPVIRLGLTRSRPRQPDRQRARPRFPGGPGGSSNSSGDGPNRAAKSAAGPSNVSPGAARSSPTR